LPSAHHALEHCHYHSSSTPKIHTLSLHDALPILLKELGLVKELTYGDDSSRFDCSTEEHYHIICEECGKIVDFHYPTLDEIESLAEKISGFEISHHRMELYGVCNECVDEKSQEKEELNV